MNGKTHKMGGVCAGIITTSFFLNQYTSNKLILGIILIIGSSIGSLIPDIDHRNSTMGHKHKITSYIVSKLFKHRGITHAPLIHILIYWGLLTLKFNFIGYAQLIYVSFITGLFIGGMSHIFLDSLTPSGTPWLYPFTKKKFSLIKLNVSTGKNNQRGRSKTEIIVNIIMIIITIFIVKIKLF